MVSLMIKSYGRVLNLQHRVLTSWCSWTSEFFIIKLLSLVNFFGSGSSNIYISFYDNKLYGVA